MKKDNEVSRREFLSLTALGAAGLAIPKGSFNLLPILGQQPTVLVPADKKLSPAWIKSLYERGAPTAYTGEALQRIGMPIGGICTGQLYFSGDGRLWLWDVFNQPAPSNIGPITVGFNYKNPMKPTSPFKNGFGITYEKAGARVYRHLDARGFKDVRFVGRYPMASVTYADAECPVEVSLTAFSPFIPLNADDSGLPATVMSYTVKNRSKEMVDMDLFGYMENAVCLNSRKTRSGLLNDAMVYEPGFRCAHLTAKSSPEKEPDRPDVLFEDFEKETYEGWTVEGSAFGTGPVEIAKMPEYQGDVHGKGKWVVNTHNTRHGEDVVKADTHLGSLTSRPFTIERNFITFLLGGGNHPGKTCINLLVDEKVVKTETGRNSNEMRPVSWDVREWMGKSGVLQVLDQETGGWGQIGLDDIFFSDNPRRPAIALEEESDFGSMGLAMMENGDCWDSPCNPEGDDLAEAYRWVQHVPDLPFPAKMADTVGQRIKLQPGATHTVTFVVTWYFPNPLRPLFHELQRHDIFKRYYSVKFKSALDVARYVIRNMDRLAGDTKKWTDTWYDSTLPYWFLDRTFANTSILASATCNRFDDGRFYGFEGIYCCAGTCTHVWQYAQAVGRIFPELERDTRERVDYGIAFHPDTGLIGHRAEAWDAPATDGQCGTILRAYREHLMSADDKFLRRNWTKIRKSIEYLIHEDGNSDGILEGDQPNTLDAVWTGRIAWISGMYVAVLLAGEAMARDVGDADFVKNCREIAERGKKGIDETLWNGEYYIQKPDPNHPEHINTNTGCHIDQVFGQSWVWQLGLPRVFPVEHCKKALESLYRYNYAPDVGNYRDKSPIKGGRWYALPGEPGLLMTTFPHGGGDKAGGTDPANFVVGYFNECMTGFEYQVAANMMYEGLVQDGLTITRTIHDRYSGERRNPYNEIECSDHYARAMASYGVFLGACGFEYDGPKGHIEFAPRMTPNNFRAPFTAAEGWGTFGQQRTGKKMHAKILVRHGSLHVNTVALEVAGAPKQITVSLDKLALPFTHTQEGNRIVLDLQGGRRIDAGQALTVQFE